MAEDNDNDGKKARASSLVKQAREALDRDDFDTAIDLCAEAIELGSDYAEAYYIRGNAYDEKVEYGLAIADYNRAIELESDYAEAYYNRGNTYDAKGEYNLAIADYTKAIEINRDDAEAYYNRGNACYKKGEYNLAIADYTEAIGLDPGLADAYDNRGNAHHEKGEFDLALADYREAMDLGSDNAVESHNRTLAVARQSAQKTIDEYKKRYGDQLKEALAAREKQLQDEFAERGKQFEEMLSRLENPQAIVAKFERREVLYTVSVWGLNVFIIIFALAVATVLPVVAWLVLRELTDLAYQPSPVPEWAVLPLLSLVLGLISYPLFSQLRHLRDVRNRLEVCREDYFRKGIIAEYIIRAGISDGDRRQEAIAKFQSHLAEKSAAEFLSNHEKPAKKGGGRTFLGDVYNLASPDAGDDISRF